MEPLAHRSAALPSTIPARAIRISRAERRVLSLMLKGFNNGAIATALTLSRRTVEGHVSALLRKTGCHSRTQLVLWALSQG
ncbi:MAG: LuxR C-terminal-related transcriptional regulator [Cyanobacteriota bacterium]|nr:LuxR C-terminal-related transcriptional regulator [Cyanobacteriota bacterium]